MLRRRAFLAGGVGALAIPAIVWPLGQRSAVDASSIDPRALGAAGDGRTDDRQAVMAAIERAVRTGQPVDGGDAIFAVRGNVEVTRKARPWIQSLRLRQLAPSDDRKTLHFRDCEQIRIDRLEIDVGTARRVGYMNDSGGLWIDGGSGHGVRNVDVFGHGKNSLIAIWNCSDSLFENIIARDSEFDAPGITDDVMQGIFMLKSRKCVLRNARVSNLAGNALYRGRPFRNLRTRGITLGGCQGCTLVDPQVRNVDQGIDITGSDGNTAISVVGGRAFECASVGLKFANTAMNCRAENFLSERCGSLGFQASGPAEGDPPYTSNIDFVGCTALDIGYNRLPTTTMGFQIQAGTGAKGHYVSYPKGIRFIRCRAIDRQAVKTMEFGFRTNIVNDPSGRQKNELIDCESEGHLVAAQLGFDVEPA